MKQILIDAAYPEETRVAVIKDGIVQSIDRDALSVSKLIGNVYLAKVTRVEPSLQAAFVDYGGSRHGFLPFADISPEYYQIDEDKKLELMGVTRADISNYEQALHSKEQPTVPEEGLNPTDVTTTGQSTTEQNDVNSTTNVLDTTRQHQQAAGSKSTLDGETIPSGTPTASTGVANHTVTNNLSAEIALAAQPNGINRVDTDTLEENYHIIDGSDLSAEISSSANAALASEAKAYQIQDVIKAGQMIIVQVVKEERGAKGAALTTYLSLAGRYCVFMPNTPGRGGISKKVENIRDRKILKEILSAFIISPFSSAIIRTAGIGHKPEDIFRDYEYLKRLWEAIRTLAAESQTPCFLHDEDDVIKRCIRDIYDEDIDEIVIEGNSAFDEIKQQFQLILPHEQDSNKIKRHSERKPIFDYYGVEKQFAELYERRVILPSGGSLVIDITEALVAIDVNSGKTTSERTIEETAVKTNVEAAYEIARQARLRNLAGLIVIDFIDMYEERNRRIVEKTLREATMNDRAKIQILKISGLGLMEMSRQRLAASFYESSSMTCPCCGGTGVVLSAEIMAISILRNIRNACGDSKAQAIHVSASGATVAYILNYKRENITQMEQAFHVYIFLHADDHLGEKGFEVRKTRTLSDEEQRDLLMKVSTARIDSEKIEAECQDEEYTGPALPIAETTAKTTNHNNNPNNRVRTTDNSDNANKDTTNHTDKIRENYLRYKQDKNHHNSTPGILSKIIHHIFGSTDSNTNTPDNSNNNRNRDTNNNDGRYRRRNNRRNNNRRNNNPRRNNPRP